jgi:4-hydroxy-2-oxoglutarate aldolase
MKLSGIFAAITTPFDYNGDIYGAKIEHNLSRWNATSLAGYLVGSSAGEGVLLSHDEKILVWELTAKHAGEGRILLADVSVEGVREASDLACHAARLGYRAVLAMTPAHYSGIMCASESQTLYFRALADRSPLPVIITGELSSESIARLSQHPRIAGVVTNANHATEIKSILASARSGFQVLTGSAPHLWSALKEGAQGAVLAFAAASPYAAIAVWEAFRTREEDAGLDWQERIALPSSLVTDVYGPAGMKYAMDLNGYYGGPPRLPLIPVSADARAEIEKAFEGFSGKT